MKHVSARQAVMLTLGMVATSRSLRSRPAPGPTYDLKKLKGSITADGSSTVGPYTTATAELFRRAGATGVKITVGISGTGGGGGKQIWDHGSKVSNWKDVRAGFPDAPLKLFGPGTDSGTFDYFTEVINGKGGRSRSDYQASEDDNVLVQGVSGERGGMGYFGYSYFTENQNRLNAVQIRNPSVPGTCRSQGPAQASAHELHPRRESSTSADALLRRRPSERRPPGRLSPV